MDAGWASGVFHLLAVEVCRREGKKKQVDIAQVSEILRCVADINHERPAFVALALLNTRHLSAQKPNRHNRTAVRKTSSRKARVARK
jgi:hypothetical protein